MSLLALARRAAPLVLAASACTSASVVNNTNNFLGAQEVQFLCLEPPTAAGRPWGLRPTSDCGLSDVDNGPTDPRGRYRLHAVVSQFQRGELALVDLATTEGVAIVDNSPSIPGFTFVPVSELPAAMVADVRDARDADGHVSGWVWLSSATSGNVLRVTATSLRNDPTRAGAGERGTLSLGGVATDLAIDANGAQRSLVAAVPDRGAIAVVDVTDPESPGAVRTIPLTAPAMDGGVGDGGASATARPAAVAIDSAARRAYVADEVNPVVYVVDLDAGTMVSTLNVGAPSRSVALTGVARARSCDAAVDPDHCARAKYLYLVGARDGALRVWDVTRGEAVRPNLLPAPNPDRRRVDPSLPEDRVALPAPASAVVTFETREYNAADPDAPTLDEAVRCDVGDPCRAGINAGPGQLRGVYVAVAMRNGRLSIVDVDDYEAPCREAACEGVSDPTQVPYRFVRHAPRAAEALTDPPRVAAPPATTVIVTGSTTGQPIEADQAAALVCGEARTLAMTPECGMSENYGITLAPREIASSTPGVVTYGAADPYVARNESWAVVYEGVLPGLEQSGGALAVRDGELTLDSPGAAFCARGALANDRARRAGDQERPRRCPPTIDLCAALFGAGNSAVANRDFVVERAYNDRLVLRAGGFDDVGVVLEVLPAGGDVAGARGWQWIVLGTVSGFLPRCAGRRAVRVDPEAQGRVDTLVNRCRDQRNLTNLRAAACPAARACTGSVDATGQASRLDAPVFANPWLCFQIFPALTVPMGQTVPVAATPDRDTQITFSTTGAYAPWSSSVGSLLTSVRWVPGVDRLFVVDTQLNGLVEFRVNPFARGRVFN
ncbi:MAG: hypothetical protein R3A52_00445 [Polyangiales bacterium]